MPIEGNQAVFVNKLKLTLRPMIGVIGVAPAEAPAPTLLAGLHGGNLDHNGVGEGAVVYLPVYVPGALLSLGDGHALMGDGELTGSGLEVATKTTIRVELLKNVGLTRPWVRDGERFSAVGFGADTDTAISDAALAMTELLARRHDLTFEDAYLLVGLVGDGVLCQTCQHPHVPAIVRIEVPWACVSPWP
jgi:amidase